MSTDPFDHLKRIEVAPKTKLDIGGEYRMRAHNENNRRLEGRYNHFLLQRTRLYGDLKVDDRFRVFAEYVDATGAYERLPSRGVDENRSDIINLFADLKLWGDCDDRSLWIRAGRQHLFYGQERVITPSNWSNVTTPYDGFTLLWKGKDWDVDAFWTRPVPLTQHVNNDHNFDNPDQGEQDMGVYATYHGTEDLKIEGYYVRRDVSDPRVMSEDGTLGGFDTNTFGTRWVGRHENWLYEAEGGYQFGKFSRDDISAGFFTLVGGYEFDCLPWKPVFKVYYDWASGDSDPTDGRRGTYDQFNFPQSHQYLGLLDLVGRQNIDAWEFRLTAKPCERITLRGSYHIFHLAQARDALYDNAAAPVRRDATGASGSDLGKELDFTVRVQMDQHASLLLGYSYVFAGDYLANTGVGDDADFLYMLFSYKF